MIGKSPPRFKFSQSHFLFLLLGVDPRLVSHPPHLKNGSEVSAFIPFCAFEGELMISDELSWQQNMPFPSCQSFTPISLDGQLCYKLQVNKTTKGSDNREGLLLILDMNEDMLFPFDSQIDTMKIMNPTLFSSNLMTSVNLNSAKIHIKTLSGFKSFGPGSYRMTSVKKLEGTKDFLSMSQADRKCSLEDFEDCRRQALFEKCKCVLWELGIVQVNFLHIKDNSTLEFDNSISGC